MMSKTKLKPCATCLSLCKFDFPVNEEIKDILRILLHDFGIDDFFHSIPQNKQLRLCNTCYQTLHDMIAFKKRALHSFNEIKKYWCLNELECHNKRSNVNIESVSHAQKETHFDNSMTLPKDEIKGETDPLETVQLYVFSHTHTASDPHSLTNDIKHEIADDNDGSNSETESADSEDDWENAITKYAVPKTRKSNGTEIHKIVTKAGKPYVYIKDTKKPTMKTCSVRLRPMMMVTSVTSEPTYRTAATNPEPSVTKDYPKNVPISKPEPQIMKIPHVDTRQMPSKDHKRTSMQPYVLDSDTDSEVSGGDSKKNKYYHLKRPWYITVLSRADIVRKREERLKDPKFKAAQYKCYHCGHIFPAKGTHCTHQKLCHSKSKDNAEFRCFACSCSFDTLPSLVRHTQYHSLGSHVYQCTTCEYTTDDTYFVRFHACPNKGGPKVPPTDPAMKLSRARKQLYCPKCDHLSITSGLQSHYNQCHTNSPEVTCKYCGKWQKNEQTCRKHIYNSHPEKPREKKMVMFCAPCLLSFYSMAAYRAHMSTGKHTPKDQLKFKCDECPKKFLTDKLLEKHKKMHEMIRNGEKNNKCTICGKSYYFANTLRQHMREKHTAPKTTRDHICDVCGKGFTQYQILRGHMAQHSDERPYKCTFCGDTFKYSGALYTHTKLKHKKKPKPDDKRKGKSTKKQRCKSKNSYKGCEQVMETHDQSMESHELGMSLVSQENEQSMESQENEQSIEAEVRDTITIKFDQLMDMEL